MARTRSEIMIKGVQRMTVGVDERLAETVFDGENYGLETFSRIYNKDTDSKKLILVYDMKRRIL